MAGSNPLISQTLKGGMFACSEGLVGVSINKSPLFFSTAVSNVRAGGIKVPQGQKGKDSD